MPRGRKPAEPAPDVATMTEEEQAEFFDRQAKELERKRCIRRDRNTKQILRQARSACSEILASMGGDYTPKTEVVKAAMVLAAELADLMGVD